MIRSKQYNLDQSAAITHMLTFSGCNSPALVDLLIKMTRSWEAERNKVFLYDQVRYFTLRNILNSLLIYIRKHVLKKCIRNSLHNS